MVVLYNGVLCWKVQPLCLKQPFAYMWHIHLPLSESVKEWVTLTDGSFLWISNKTMDTWNEWYFQIRPVIRFHREVYRPSTDSKDILDWSNGISIRGRAPNRLIYLTFKNWHLYLLVTFPDMPTYQSGLGCWCSCSRSAIACSDRFCQHNK